MLIAAAAAAETLLHPAAPLAISGSDTMQQCGFAVAFYRLMLQVRALPADAKDACHNALSDQLSELLTAPGVGGLGPGRSRRGGGIGYL